MTVEKPVRILIVVWLPEKRVLVVLATPDAVLKGDMSGGEHAP